MFDTIKNTICAIIRPLAVALPLLFANVSYANNSETSVLVVNGEKFEVANNETVTITTNAGGKPIVTTKKIDDTTAKSAVNLQGDLTQNVIPKQSTQQGVTADKLILNNPVIDQAQILSAHEKQQIEQKLRDIYQRGLAQPAVVIVPTTGGEDIFQYAMQVADKWQLGDKDTDKGLLMVIAINDRKLQILTGYGLEGTIPDAIAKRIITDDIAPYFKQNDYAGGIVAGINRLEERLTTDPQILQQADAERQKLKQIDQISPIAFGVMSLFIGVFLVVFFGEFLGLLITFIGTIVLGVMLNVGFFTSLLIALIVGLILLNRNNGGGGGGGFIVMPSGGGLGGSFGGGDSYSGGGGGFGGGGAGGSW